MTNATVIFEARLADFDQFKTMMTRGIPDRRELTGAGHTMARDLQDPSLVRLIVDFDDLAKAEKWMTAFGAPEKLDSILDQAGLAERPRLWLGANVERVEY